MIICHLTLYSIGMCKQMKEERSSHLRWIRFKKIIMLTFNLTESKERESYDDSMLKEAAVYRQLHPHISLIHPGFLRHTYEGEVVKQTNPKHLPIKSIFYCFSFQLPNLPQMEDLHIIDSTADHLLILWCHGMPDVNLNGALVSSFFQ